MASMVHPRGDGRNCNPHQYRKFANCFQDCSLKRYIDETKLMSVSGEIFQCQFWEDSPDLEKRNIILYRLQTQKKYCQLTPVKHPLSGIHPWKPTWLAGKSLIFNRKYIDSWSIFQPLILVFVGGLKWKLLSNWRTTWGSPTNGEIAPLHPAGLFCQTPGTSSGGNLVHLRNWRP